MAIGSIWFPEPLTGLLNEIRLRLNGHIPILNVITDKQPRGPASFFEPTLYPELNIPNEPNGNWGEVAVGMFHILLSLDGLPELRSSKSEQLANIAQYINSELHHITFNLSGIEPKPIHILNLIDQTNDLIKNMTNQLDGYKIIFGIKLLRHQLAGHPQAIDALILLERYLPTEVNDAKELFSKLISLPLKEPLGKDQAAKLLIETVGLNKNDFTLRTIKFFNGLYEHRPLGYTQHLNYAHKKFFESTAFPHAWLQFRLPFDIPVMEGTYKLTDGVVFLRHHTVSNDRASWTAGIDTAIDTMMSPSGFYKQTTVEVLLPGRPDIRNHIPPAEVMYKNLSSYPTAVIQSTILLNKLINSLRKETGRCDIPEVIPAYFNKLAFKQFNEAGEVEIGIPCLSLEFVRITDNLQFKNSDIISQDINSISDLPFYSELLEAAKLHLISYNLRRSILDFCGAFEAFIAKYITPHVENNQTNNKEQFLKQYGEKLNPETKEEISNLSESGDKKRPALIRSILKSYNKKSNVKVLDNDIEKKIMDVFSKYRDLAAHGKPIPDDIQEELSSAIESFDKLIKDWEQSFA